MDYFVLFFQELCDSIVLYNKGWCIVENSVGIKNLVTILEPLVEDLDEKKQMLSDKKNEFENVSRLIAYTKDNIEMVGVYADQDIITNSLEKLGYSVDEYKASCYLLKGDNEYVKSLPQYKEAYESISSIIEYFKSYKAQLALEIQDLSMVCSTKELEKKYYDVLSCPNPLVEDVHEFVSFMRDHNLKNEEIITILYSTIHDNMVNYELKSN